MHHLQNLSPVRGLPRFLFLPKQALLHQALAVVAQVAASQVADTQAVAVVTLVEEDK